MKRKRAHDEKLIAKHQALPTEINDENNNDEQQTKTLEVRINFKKDNKEIMFFF
jgi:hypothetical protein